MLHVFLLAALALPLPSRGASGIAWEASFEGAFERAKSERRVVFIAVNMDGERANDTLATKVYADKRIRELSLATVPLVASVAEHAASGRPCPRFGGITCAAHREVDATVRQEVLEPDAEGWVVAPQHVFLDPDGKVILSVPYEISAGELEWCFVTAIASVDPEFRWRLSAGASAPRRLILGGVFQLGPNGAGRVLTRAQVLELISELKKGSLGWEARVMAVRDVLTSDEPEALTYIRNLLRTAFGGFGGGGGRGGGGGGGGLEGLDARGRILHQIGVHSPRAYWEIAAEYIDGEASLRAEAIVALEQLGAPEALKALQAALRKEKDPRIEKKLLRALGSCGAADKGARTTLIRAATRSKEPVLRHNAILALGSLAPDDDVRALLTSFLAAEQPLGARVAAACAMGMSRDTSWRELLEASLEEARAADMPELVEACEAALSALTGGGLAPLREPVRKVCDDTIERERLFGFVVE